MKKLEKNEEKTDPNNLPLEYLYSELQKTYIPVFEEDAPVLKVKDKLVIEGTTFDREKALEDVTATKNDKKTDLKSNVQVDVDKVDTNKPGEYELTYTITDDGITISKTIKVTVWGKPNIEATNKTIVQGEVFNKEKALENVTAQAHDKTDITKDIQVDFKKVDTSKAGTYDVTYTVTDAKGAESTKTITVTVKKESNNLPSGNGGNIISTPNESEEKEEIPNKKPSIDASDKVIKVDTKFDPLEGVTATDGEDNDITKDIKVTKNTVDTSKEGEYEVRYEVTDSKGQTVDKTITVSVKKDGIPSIEATDKVIKVNTKFEPLEGATAKDGEDNDITKDIKVIKNTVDTSKEGEYEVRYEVTDSKGQTVDKTITVSVKKDGIPSIDASDKVIKPNTKFDPSEGVTATDGDGKDITKKVKVIKNEVNTKKPGKYEVTYEVTDSKDQTVQKTITVTVKKDGIPSIDASDKVIKPVNIIVSQQIKQIPKTLDSTKLSLLYAGLTLPLLGMAAYLLRRRKK